MWSSASSIFISIKLNSLWNPYKMLSPPLSVSLVINIHERILYTLHYFRMNAIACFVNDIRHSIKQVLRIIKILNMFSLRFFFFCGLIRHEFTILSLIIISRKADYRMLLAAYTLLYSLVNRKCITTWEKSKWKINIHSVMYSYHNLGK